MATARCSRSPSTGDRLRQHADHAGQLQRRQRYEPAGGLIADAAGDLFGTTVAGGADGDGTVFEIAKTGARLRQHADHAGQLQRRATVRSATPA